MYNYIYTIIDKRKLISWLTIYSVINLRTGAYFEQYKSKMLSKYGKIVHIRNKISLMIEILEIDEI